MKITLETVLAETRDIKDPDELASYFLALAGRMGFSMAALHSLPQSSAVADQAVVDVQNFPKDYVDYYLNADGYKSDPMAPLASQQRSPLLWKHVDDFHSLTKEAQDHRNIAIESGLADGLTVPIFGPRGELAFASLSSGKERLDLASEEIDRLQYICYHIYNLIRSQPQASDPLPSLSPRESEVLLWVAQGKSNAVIADILKISSHTVDTILRRVYAKLDVSSRVAAAIKAVQLGLIHP